KSSCERRDVEQQTHPVIERRSTRGDLGHLHERGSNDERQNQDDVDVKGKPDRGNDTDEPLGGSECHWLVSKCIARWDEADRYSSRIDRSPASTAAMNRGGIVPTNSSRKDRSTVMIFEMLTTESLGSPVALAGTSTLPGDPASNRLLVIITMTTVGRRLS